VKAVAPDVVVAPGAAVLVAWHEERFPSIRTVVTRLSAAPAARRTK